MSRATSNVENGDTLPAVYWLQSTAASLGTRQFVSCSQKSVRSEDFAIVRFNHFLIVLFLLCHKLQRLHVFECLWTHFFQFGLMIVTSELCICIQAWLTLISVHSHNSSRKENLLLSLFHKIFIWFTCKLIRIKYDTHLQHADLVASYLMLFV